MSDKDEVKVRVKIGDLEVEIEGPPEKISAILSKVVGDLGSGHTQTKKEVFHKSCKEVIEELWREGWFNVERKLSDVYIELSKRGYNFDKSAISHALASLAKEGILRRVGRERKYRYVQKYPYSQLIKRE